MKVRAKVKLYHGVVREAGDEFSLLSEDHFDKRVHEAVGARSGSAEPAPPGEPEPAPQEAETTREPVKSPDEPEPAAADEASTAPRRVRRRGNR